VSDFKDLLEDDLDDVFYNTDEFAETVTYAGKSIAARLFYGTGDEHKGYDDFDVRAVIKFKKKDVAAVLTGDTILIGTQNWEVIGATLSKDGLEWEAMINRRTS
jgi:hypothetical protein